MSEEINVDISKKLNVLISISLRQALGEKEFWRRGRRKRGVGDLARFLGDLGLSAKDIAEICADVTP